MSDDFSLVLPSFGDKNKDEKTEFTQLSLIIDLLLKISKKLDKLDEKLIEYKDYLNEFSWKLDEIYEWTQDQ